MHPDQQAAVFENLDLLGVFWEKFTAEQSFRPRFQKN